MSFDIREQTHVLEKYKSIPQSPPRDLTFLEISGYPSRETVFSNIFSFFFDTEASHGLGNLFLFSLLSILDIDGEKEQTQRVQPEERTDDGKRIDIVIETSSYVIGIENKVYADIYNPFSSYQNHLMEYCKDNSLKDLGVILCLNDCCPDEETRKLHGFHVVTYTQLFEEIKQNIGKYLISASPKYLTMLFDFMESIENLKKGSSMNKQALEFFQKNESDITNLLEEVKKLQRELKQKAQDLGSRITYDANVKQWYWKPPQGLFHTLVHDIELSEESVVGIDANVRLDGWQIEYFNRKGGNMDTLANLLNSLGIEFEKSERDFNRLCHSQIFPYDAEKQNQLADTLQNAIVKISSENQ